MLHKVKERLKNQQGFTLIELLAVIVILGILAAIAIPSILGIINNSKKDAFVADAQQMVSSAKMAVANNSNAQPAAGTPLYLSLNYLEKQGYLDSFTDPDGGTITLDSVSDPATAATGMTSYVEVTNDNGTFTYTVTLIGSKRQIKAVISSSLDRSSVQDITTTTTTSS